MKGTSINKAMLAGAITSVLSLGSISESNADSWTKA